MPSGIEAQPKQTSAPDSGDDEENMIELLFDGPDDPIISLFRLCTC